MTTNPKPTAWPWEVRHEDDSIFVTANKGRIEIAKFFHGGPDDPNKETATFNVALSVDAANVYHETGLTPRELFGWMKSMVIASRHGTTRLSPSGKELIKRAEAIVAAEKCRE